MATEEKRIENMDKYYPEVKSFFKNIQITGTLKERAKTVRDYVDLKYGEDHFVIAAEAVNRSWSVYVTNGYSQFTNNGVNYYIGEQTAFSKVEDFKRKVILAIDSAETKGGTLSEKRNRFLEIFTENVNVVVAKASEAGVHFSYRYGCEFEETRNGTTYEAWIY